MDARAAGRTASRKKARAKLDTERARLRALKKRGRSPEPEATDSPPADAVEQRWSAEKKVIAAGFVRDVERWRGGGLELKPALDRAYEQLGVEEAPGEMYVRRADISLMSRGDAAAATWIFRGDGSRRRGGRRVETRSRPADAAGTR